MAGLSSFTGNFAWPTFARAIFLALLFASLTSAQNAAHPSSGSGSSSLRQTDDGDYKVTVHSNLVFLPTRVETRRGEPIYGLEPEQFIVEDNGVRQSVQVDADPDSWGLSLVVAVQCSRSAPAEFGKLKGLSAMIDGIVGDAPHEVAILTYGEKPYVLDDFSTDPQSIPMALSKVGPCGDYHAASIDAVDYAINMLEHRQSHYRRVILLISETRDYGSRARLSDVVAELGVSDTVIYTVAFSPARDNLLQDLRNDVETPQDPPSSLASPPQTSPTTEAKPSPPAPEKPVYTEHPPALVLPPQLELLIGALKRNTASELAALSGGEYVNFTTQKGFESGLQRISNQVHDFYVLSFKPTGPALSLHSLQVRVANYPDAVIQTRKTYWSEIDESASGE